MNQRYLDIIEFLNEETRVLREIIDKKVIPLTNQQRRRLAAKFVELDKKLAEQQELLVTPDTILKWYRLLICQKWDHSNKVNQRGRPLLEQEIVNKVIELLKENPNWGDESVSNRLRNLKIILSPSSVGNIRRTHGIPPAPERQKTGSWERFLAAMWPMLAAMDFTTVEILDPVTNELTTMYLLFAMHLDTREVQFVGMTENPHEEWMLNQARKLTDPIDGFLINKTHMIIDNDTIFGEAFQEALNWDGPKCVRTCIKTPNMNANMERFFRTFKEEALTWTIPRSEWHLRWIIKEHLAYYHEERNHQGIDGEIINPGDEVGQSEGNIVCKERLGGNLRYYYREVA